MREAGERSLPRCMALSRHRYRCKIQGLNNKPGPINYICSLPQAFLFACNLEKMSNRVLVRRPSSGYFSMYQNIKFSLIASEEESMLECSVLVRRSSGGCKTFALCCRNKSNKNKNMMLKDIQKDLGNAQNQNTLKSPHHKTK